VTAAIVARGGPDETRRLLAVVSNLKVRTLRSLGYGCGLRASEVVRLKVKHIDSAQKVIRIEQSKGRNDCNVMLSPETLDLLRQWWKTRPSRYDAGAPVAERWLFPGNRRGKPGISLESSGGGGIGRTARLAIDRRFSRCAADAAPPPLAASPGQAGIASLNLSRNPRSG
jgi:integrase